MAFDAKSKILIADDQQHILDTLQLFLESEGFVVETVKQIKDVHLRLNQQHFDLLMLDMNFTQDTTSGKEGLSLLETIRSTETHIPIIMMTAWARVELVVDAMKKGANDFIEKPWKNNRLINTINAQIHLANEKKINRELSAVIASQSNVDTLIAESNSMKSVLEMIERTASSDANILLTGESGVGKSLLAEFIHGKSNRINKPLISVNMGALSDNLFESELFGHMKGAFTDAKDNRMGRFEMADKGTLFMDEVAIIPFALQGKLLRVLESGQFEPLGSSKTKQVDVRLISASNVDFDHEINEGRFRNDLLYRLNTVTIDIPPLRRRLEDIQPLANYFLKKFQLKYHKPDLSLTGCAIKELKSYPWPGNIRELSHVIEKSVLMSIANTISGEALSLNNKPATTAFEQMTLDEAETYLIEQAMSRYNENIADASEALGISRSALYRRLEKLNAPSNNEEK